MKDKLEKIQEALVGAKAMFDEGVPKWEWDEIKTNIREAQPLVEELLSELDSPEMMEKVRIAIQESDESTASNGYVTLMNPVIAQDAAQAAINTIKGDSE